MNFTNKETYLQYRKEWKLKFLATINSIKRAKRAIKEANSKYDASRSTASLLEIHKAYRGCREARSTFNEMLAEISNARKLASEQRLSNLKKTT